MISSEELQQGLAWFTGTQNWYRHCLLKRFLYTDGIKYLADEAQAHWLIDAIASYQISPIITSSIDLKEFQLWLLTVDDSRGTLKCYTDSPQTGQLVIAQDVVFTDFPLPEIKLYVESNVLLLPSEH